ncbi:hypothetical protein [Streptomyces griseoloalbus]|uniref:Uncharacterized protein n=1 Tax=Streptomyces griseoloalbus TaxID=67303 RepID=A0A7W8F9Q5_9ACTN|nr:hypothetical protein [Streptomyces albaduncus]MBB5128373.1 hypothetical protein [Streptomyces albaduncus]
MTDARTGGAPADLALPPYVVGIRNEVERGCSRLRRELLHGRSGQVATIHSESVRVVTQYTKRGRPAPAALARYGRMVAEWRNAADLQRTRAQELVDEGNQLLACYWDAAWQRGRRRTVTDAEPRMDELRPAGWLPGTMALDPTWHRIDDWLDADSWYAERGRDETGPAVVQALAILRTQQPGATAGQRA